MPAVTDLIPSAEWGPRAAVSQVLRPPRLRREREDHGLFGPDSATWEVWSHPSILIAAVRAAVVQMFQAPTAAGVSQNSVYQRDPMGRLRRTGDYFLTVAYGDGRSVIEASDALRRIHDRVTGIEPITGEQYSANDPENQLWVHVTTWHTVLYCYERYGPGGLSPEREAEYWRECRLASELQVLDPADVPGSRAEVREYFASMRPQMCLSDGAREIIDWLLSPRFPESSPALKPIERVFVLVGRAAAATIPAYMRELGGFDRSLIPDRTVVPLARSGSRVLNLRLLQRGFAAASPEGYAVREAALFGPPPRRPRTVTVAEARHALEKESARAAA
jgi:uncharacterized protein (DUF2236 family)